MTAWLTMRRSWWAMEALHRQIEKLPEEAWQTLLCLIEEAEGPEMLETIGAGPLEDLLRSHAKALIESVELEAARNARLRITLGRVWVRSKKDDETVRRLVALGCQPIPPEA